MSINSKLYRAAHPAILLAIVLVFITENVLVYVSAALGILLILVSTVVVYALISVLKMSENTAVAIENISILLIYILLVSALPWFFLRQEFLVPAVYSLVLALCFWRIRSRNLTLESIGMTKWNTKDCMLGMILGIPFGIIECFVLRPLPATPSFDVFYFLQTAAYMLIFVGLGEELLFRGLIQNSLVKVMGTIPGIFWTGITFAAMHTVWRSVPELFFTFGAGLMLGAFYQRTGRLLGPIVLHATNNVILLAVMPFLI